jgi:hypothetical protein
MSAKPWWESRTFVALLVALVGVGCIWSGKPDLVEAGKWLLSAAAPIALASRVGATQPLTLTRARARKTERTE